MKKKIVSTKKMLVFLGLIVVLGTVFSPVSAVAKEVFSGDSDVVKIGTDIDTYIEENVTKARSNSRSSDDGLAALNKVVKDPDGIIHMLGAQEQSDGNIALSDTYYNPKGMKTRTTVQTSFYVNFNRVGLIHFNVTLTRHKMHGSLGNRGYHYYEWSKASDFTYDYQSHGFTVKSFSTSYDNSNVRGEISSISENIKWTTNISRTTSDSFKFYAPANY